MFQSGLTRGLYKAISWLAPNATSPLRPQEAAWVVRLQPIEMCSLEMWGMSIAKVKGIQWKSGLLYFSLLVTPTECWNHASSQPLLVVLLDLVTRQKAWLLQPRPQELLVAFDPLHLTTFLTSRSWHFLYNKEVTRPDIYSCVLCIRESWEWSIWTTKQCNHVLHIRSKIWLQHQAHSPRRGPSHCMLMINKQDPLGKKVYCFKQHRRCAWYKHDRRCRFRRLQHLKCYSHHQSIRWCKGARSSWCSTRSVIAWNMSSNNASSMSTIININKDSSRHPCHLF